MYRNFIKRLLDFSISLIAFVCISPFFLIIMIILYFANKKTGIFFRQKRPGLNGKIFSIIKFKSMTDEKDVKGNLLPNHQRITVIGTFIRKTSIDELPQLLNVIKGDMALIGPRPLLPNYLPYYTKRENLRHTVRPGITGLAQISGRNNLSWEERLNLDVQYVEKLSFLLDLKIFFLTIKKVFKRENVIVVLDENKNIPLDIYRKNQMYDKTQEA